MVWILHTEALNRGFTPSRKEDAMRGFSFKAAVILMVLAVALLAGCSKEESTTPAAPSNNTNDNPPSFGVQQVTPPSEMTQSQDPYAQQAAAYVAMANAFASYTSYLSPPSNMEAPELTSSYAGPPWTYTWSVNNGEDNFTVTLTIDETTSSYTWNVVVTGVFDGQTLDHFLFIEGEQAKDGKSGSLTIHDPETQGIAVTVNWNYDESNAYHLTYEVPGEAKIVATVNQDDSGSVAYYEWNGSAFEMVFRAVWNADGSGEWWTYEEGAQTGHGTWG